MSNLRKKVDYWIAEKRGAVDYIVNGRVVAKDGLKIRSGPGLEFRHIGYIWAQSNIGPYFAKHWKLDDMGIKWQLIMNNFDRRLGQIFGENGVAPNGITPNGDTPDRRPGFRLASPIMYTGAGVIVGLVLLYFVLRRG